MREILFSDARDYIKFEFELRRSRRPSYSMRAFARDLQMSASGLNDFLKGRVGISESRTLDISDKLKWPEKVTDHFKDLLASKHHRDLGVRQAASLRVRKRLKGHSNDDSLDNFAAISDWYHMAILELMEQVDHLEPIVAASRLEIDVKVARQAFKRLQRLNLISQTAKGFKPTDQSLYYGDEGASSAVVNFHSQIMDLSKKMLTEKNVSDREVQSIVFSVDSEKVAEMNAELKRVTLNILNKYAQFGNADTVQVFSMQSYAVSDGKRDEK